MEEGTRPVPLPPGPVEQMTVLVFFKEANTSFRGVLHHGSPQARPIANMVSSVALIGVFNQDPRPLPVVSRERNQPKRTWEHLYERNSVLEPLQADRYIAAVIRVVDL